MFYVIAAQLLTTTVATTPHEGPMTTVADITTIPAVPAETTAIVEETTTALIQSTRNERMFHHFFIYDL